MQDDYQNDLDLLNLENNPFTFKKNPSLNKNNLSSKNTGNYTSTRNRRKQILNNTRKSFDNILNNIPQKKLQRFNTQKNVIRINYINTIPKYSTNLDNDFILAKKNNIYGNKTNNNGQMNILINNNDIKLNEEFFAKEIKSRFIKNYPQVKNYKIIINKNKNYKPNIYYINGNNNNNNINNNIEKKILDKFNKNNFNMQKKISFDKLKIFDMNLTMPNSNSKRNELDEDNLGGLTEKKNLNHNVENKNLPKPQKAKIFRNIKFMNQKTPKTDIIKNIIQKQYSEIKEKNINKYNQKENDLSLGYATDVKETMRNGNNYRKSKSGFINYNFFSEKKGRNRNNNNNDESDEDIDEVLDNLDIYYENEDKKNKTFIEKDSNLLNESLDLSDNLSDLADELVNNYPEQESEDINKQSTVPSTSNLESDAMYDSSNNNLNMNNIKFNNPFHSNKVTNTKSTMVNNNYISSPTTRNKSNKSKNDINYNSFAVNEYNNTNININNNIKINNYKDNSNIPKLATKTYKSPFIIGNMKNKKNSLDINEIEISEMNMDLNEFKNIDTINLSLNNSTNINMKNKYMYNTEKKPNLNRSNNQIFNLSQSVNNSMKNSTNNTRGRKFSDSILRDLLSSHKNTPTVNNNNKMSDKKEFININNNYNNDFEIFNGNNNFDEDELVNKNNIILLNELKNENNYLYKSKEDSKNIINNSIKKSIQKKKKGHISFNLDKNIYIKFGKEDFITNSLITDKNGQICEHLEKNMVLYNEELKGIKPKPIIKKFSTNEIRINKEYIYVENLQERQILPDLYDEFEEQDIKSLEKCLEKSVDKM